MKTISKTQIESLQSTIRANPVLATPAAIAALSAWLAKWNPSFDARRFHDGCIRPTQKL